MIVPSTRFEIIDQSFVPPVTTFENKTPLFFYVFSSDKGPEGLRFVSDTNFKKLYGEDISFERHGQPLLQAAISADEGAYVLAKRVVAPDSTLANLGIVAKVTKEETQKEAMDNGVMKPVYIDKVTGKETFEEISSNGEDVNEPVMISKAIVNYEQVSIEGKKTIEEARNSFLELGKNNVFPLFLISDVGRGESGKKIRITPRYVESRSISFMKYLIEVIEKNTVIESAFFAFDPDVVENDVNRSISNVIRLYSNQLKCVTVESEYEEFVNLVAEYSNITPDVLKGMDLLFGTDRRGRELVDVVVNTENGFDFSNVYGNALVQGTNGSFGNAPFGTVAYESELVKFFNGEITDDIYDVDRYQIDALIDANYPTAVKRKIEELANYREDFYYFGDMRTTVSDLSDITSAALNETKTKYADSCGLVFDMIDPYSKKQIRVTRGINLAKLLVPHFKTNRHKPLAGDLNNFVFRDAIEGTVNFLPKVTPKVNQKEILNEAKINYASYIDDRLVMQTLYTRQEADTQLSFINNVLAIQEVIKAIRVQAPKSRYSFMSGEDLSKYLADVNRIIEKYTGNFASLKFQYMQDPAMVANKVFYAALEVKFNNFIQSEYFKIFVIN